MPRYRERPLTLAEALGGIPGVQVTRPQTNAFAVYLPGSLEELEEAHLELARRTGVWLFNSFAVTPVPGLVLVEVQVGAAAAAIPDDEVIDLVSELLSKQSAPDDDAS